MIQAFMRAITEEEFPSPIYGASFKPEVVIVDEDWKVLFPSPIYGASFKHEMLDDNSLQYRKFPSPIYGASFKLVIIYMY